MSKRPFKDRLKTARTLLGVITTRPELPNACYLGFTGTPIDKKDKSTRVHMFRCVLDAMSPAHALANNYIDEDRFQELVDTSKIAKIISDCAW